MVFVQVGDGVGDLSALSLDLEDPGLAQARDRMGALAVGSRITADFDTWTKKTWRLTRADGGPGFGDADIARWRLINRAEGLRRAEWALGIGLALVVAGLVNLVRGSD